MPDCGGHCLWFALVCFLMRSRPPPNTALYAAAPETNGPCPAGSEPHRPAAGPQPCGANRGPAACAHGRGLAFDRHERRTQWSPKSQQTGRRGGGGGVWNAWITLMVEEMGPGQWGPWGGRGGCSAMASLWDHVDAARGRGLGKGLP